MELAEGMLGVGIDRPTGQVLDSGNTVVYIYIYAYMYVCINGMVHVAWNERARRARIGGANAEGCIGADFSCRFGSKRCF